MMFRRRRPGPVEARPGGAVPGRSRPSPAALSRCNWSVGRRRPVRHRRHLPGSALTCDRESGGSGSRAREGGDRACARAHHQLLGLKGNGEHAHAWLDLRQGGWREAPGAGVRVGGHACVRAHHQLRGRERPRMRARITCSGEGITQTDACARVKILQHVQEELVEQSVSLGGDDEGHGFVIFGRDAVCRVVLLEVEQAACTKGMMTMALE